MSRFLANILYSLLYIISLIPLRVLYGVSDIGAFLLRDVIGYRKKTVVNNLRSCFPDIEQKELDETVKEFYKYLCDVFVETVWQISASDKDVCKVVGSDNQEVMDSFCREHNKVIMLMGHFGNWELVSGICRENETREEDNFANYGILLGYKRIRNKIMDIVFSKMRMNLYTKFKTKGGIIESHQILRHILKDKNSRQVYVFIADQSPHDGTRIVTRFLGRPTLMMPGPEYIAVKLNVPVIYMGMRRIKRGQYVIHYTIISEHPESDAEHFVIREYARLLEKDIRGTKYCWLWSHRRWKKEFSPQEMLEYERLIAK